MADEFGSRYLRICAELAVDPLQTVLDAVRGARAHDGKGSPRLLDLTGVNLTVKACVALGMTLRDDAYFAELSLADCMLGDTGCQAVVSCLKSNMALRKLDLKGNNLRAQGAAAVADMLKTNSALKSLTLEWNGVGVWETGVAALAEALGLNQTLERLDLRNNQINPQGAREIATAIKHNTALRSLDVRWNNLGATGGKAFLDALRWNASLLSLDLVGNLVPEDVVKAIESCLERNRVRHRMAAEAEARAAGIGRELHSVHAEYEARVAQLASAADKAKADAARVSGDYAETVKRLESSLEERKAAFDASERARVELEGAREALDKRIADLEGAIAALKKDERAQAAKWHDTLLQEKRVRADAEEKARKDMEEQLRQQMALEGLLRDAEMRAAVAEKDVAALRRELERSRQKETDRTVAFEERLSDRDRAHERSLEALRRRHQEELDAVRKEHEAKERRHDDRLREAVAERAAMQQALDKHQADMAALRQQIEKESKATEAKLRLEIAALSESHETRHRTLLAARDELARQVDDLNRQVAEHRQRRAEAVQALEIAERRLDDAARERNAEVSAAKAEVTRAKGDLAAANARADAASATEKTLREELQRAQRTIETMHRDHAEAIARVKKEGADAVTEVAVLRETLRRREAELESFRQEELKRVGMIETVLGGYVSSARTRLEARSHA